MRYLGRFFIAIDQLGNVLAGGNPDNTISSRVGYYNSRNYTESQVAWQWRFFEQIIDVTFYPIDGPNHCHEAYYSDSGEVFDENTKNELLVFLSAIIIIPSCIIIGFFLYSLYVFGVVSPKQINRNSEVKNRLKTVKSKLDGTLHELNDHIVKVDVEMLEKALATQQSCKQLLVKIKEMLDLKAHSKQ